MTDRITRKERTTLKHNSSDTLRELNRILESMSLAKIADIDDAITDLVESIETSVADDEQCRLKLGQLKAKINSLCHLWQRTTSTESRSKHTASNDRKTDHFPNAKTQSYDS